MQIKIKNILFIIVIFVLLLSGCTSLSYKRMIPYMGSINLNPSNATIKVLVLQGSIVDNGEAEFYERNVDDEMLRNAIVKTIAYSGLFKRIMTSGNADFDLIVKKELHHVMSIVMTAKSHLIINYKLINNKSNKIVWQDDIDTEHTCTYDEAYNTFTRHNTATEGAVKKNLLKSIEEISLTISLIK